MMPRNEYPRPQFEREEWVCLNGEWEYRFDFSKSGAARDWKNAGSFDGRINVPFCPESRLSGVGFTDFIEMMWYRRSLEIPAGWEGRKILLHFGGVDYRCVVYLDGEEVGRHTGGSAAFAVDLSRFVRPGRSHNLVVRVEDDVRSGLQPLGKQSTWLGSHGCSYTRTTGIWRTVWMEATDPCALKSCRIIPDFDGGSFTFLPEFFAFRRGLKLTTAVLENGREVASLTSSAAPGAFTLRLEHPREWNPETPFLYDIVFTLRDGNGAVLDKVRSYAGLRTIHLEDGRCYLNGRPVFLRFVLDQGFYADGIWTAPSDDALKRDIELAMKAGFNGARLHQKVFEDRFHYWADKLGYLTWSESSSWGLVYQHAEARYNFLREWIEIVDRLKDHPSILAWTPLNETAREGWNRARSEPRELFHRWVRDLYDVTKQLDPTRPVNDCSGWCHAMTDLWTVHPYRPGAKEFREAIAPADGGVMVTNPDFEVPYRGQPYIVDEFGGFKYTPGAANDPAGWGYHGIELADGDALCAKIREQVEVMLADDRVVGYCYTQLTDVEQEQNGILLYDRTPKAPLEKFAEIFGRDPEDRTK